MTTNPAKLRNRNLQGNHLRRLHIRPQRGLLNVGAAAQAAGIDIHRHQSLGRIENDAGQPDGVVTSLEKI